MPEGITAEGLVNNIMETLSDSVSKHKKVSFFEEEKSNTVSSQFNRLFGREKPVHHLLGGGKLPRLVLPEEVFVNIGKIIGSEVNRGLSFLQDVACGGNIKQFVVVVASLWAAAIIGSWCNFLTVLYIGFVAAHTLPILYERYDDQVDAFVYNVLEQLQHNYRKLDSRVLSRIPTRNFRGKKAD
ncbi:hypothetical protein DH2020_012166 [Rehmannia glutinosa]|uniref:Reticulon-like protein n=1 Tax=Rehmannia glutinosa TaxID=99300 RepID=A0ABR0XFZ0_REHGL